MSSKKIPTTSPSLSRDGKYNSTCKHPTRPDPTIMSWVLPDLLNIGSSLGFKNQTQSRFGSGPGFMHTRPEPNLYTYILLKKKLKNPSINTPLSFQIIFLNLTLNPFSLSYPLSFSQALIVGHPLSTSHKHSLNGLTAPWPHLAPCSLHSLIQPHGLI